MAKKRFQIAPKLKEDKKPMINLPVQNISVDQIEKIAVKEKSKPTIEKKAIKTDEPAKVVKAKKATAPKKKKVAKKPQGRPRRTEPVKRLSSDLPEELYERVKKEVKENGYSLNGFLAKVLREYFEKKDGK